MERKEVTFEMSTEANYWLAVDDDDLTMINNKATRQLNEGDVYILSWWVLGNPGTAYEIKIKGIKEDITIKKKIAANRDKSGGVRQFKV